MLTTFTVTSLDDTGAGTLRDAVQQANDTVGEDVVEFAPGVQGTIALTSELGITDDLIINGPGQRALSVSGGGSSRVFNTEAVVAINNLTISDGHFTGVFNGGGAIRNSGDLSLDHVVMSNNQAIDTPYGGGAAIFSFFGSLRVSHSSFENNRSTNSSALAYPVAGGAIANVGGSADIRHSRFTNNEVDSGVSMGMGGAISSTFGGTLDVSHSRFKGNSVSSNVDARGGAIGAGFGSAAVTVDHSQFVGNTAAGGAAIGGAIWSDSSSFTLDHSSVVNNQVLGADAQGGGIHNAGSFILTQSNVNANRAIGAFGDGVGGGIYNVGTFEIDENSNTHGNKASTSHDNVFGDLDLLDDVLAV